MKALSTLRLAIIALLVIAASLFIGGFVFGFNPLIASIPAVIAMFLEEPTTVKN